jgi:FdhD protein
MWKMKQNSEIPDSLKQAVRSAEIFRISSEGLTEKLADHVVIEQAVTIMIDKVGSFTIMATPSDIKALAVGFVYSEGMIDSIDDIVAVSTKPQLPNVVGIAVHDPTRISIQRNMIVASSCGMCGTRNIDKMLSEMPVCGLSLEVSSNLLIEVAERLRSMQQIFQMTGGSHAAGIFTSSGEIISFAEDLGRHSALDKAIGKCLLGRLPMKGCAVALSGRVSLEMVTKAARAGIELIAAVSAPSSFAIEAAERWNITLCGFVRPGKTNVYTHPKRIRNLQKDN